jgi:cephalosporin hydroxylase
MTFTPDDLKREAAAEKAEIESRVRGRQGGVATYFDVFLSKFLNGLEVSESLHGWNANPKELPRTDSARAVAELRWLTTYLENRREGRFVTYDARLRSDAAGKQSDIRSPERAMSQGTAACLSWKGSPLFKSVFDFAILPMLLWELKPASIFEIGSGTGASARWIADIIGSFGLNSQVYSTDIKPVREPYAGVHFLTGDSRSPTTLFGADLLRTAPRPYLVIEDAHVNVHDVFLYIDDFLIKGDYFFVEDSLSKGDDLNAFLSERPHRYLVDTLFTDFFGRNATSAINSILVRV